MGESDNIPCTGGKDNTLYKNNQLQARTLCKNNMVKFI